MKIVLVRHTRVAVERGTCYGWTDVPLADTFEQEAAATKSLLEPFGSFDAVYTSPLSRARRLAAYCGYPEAVADDRLKEMNMGEWEMQRYDDIADPYIQDWYNDYLYLPTPGGESFMQQYQRVGAFLDELRQQPLRQQPLRQALIFAHAGVLVAASIHAKLYPIEEAWHHVTDYGALLEIVV